MDDQGMIPKPLIDHNVFAVLEHFMKYPGMKGFKIIYMDTSIVFLFFYLNNLSEDKVAECTITESEISLESYWSVAVANKLKEFYIRSFDRR